MQEQRERLSQPPAIEVSTPYGKRKRAFYTNLREAYTDCLRDTGELYNVTLPMEVGIQGRLYGERGEEFLELTMGQRSGTVPRKWVHGRAGLGVSTNYDFAKWFDLCLHVFEWEDPVFDRGMFWVAINDEQAKMKFHLLRDHGATLDELLERTLEGEKKSIQIIQDALEGRYPEDELFGLAK